LKPALESPIERRMNGKESEERERQLEETATPLDFPQPVKPGKQVGEIV
jgi:hypothetical protein